MAKHIDITDGFTLSDLMAEDGFTLEVGSDLIDENNEEFSYNPEIHLSNEEVLRMLNMEEYCDEDEKDVDEMTAVMPYSMSFEKLKLKMTDITPDGKVKKLIKQKGGGLVVPYNAQVTLKYVGYFEYNDEPFDSTFAHGMPQTIRLDQGGLLPGLEIGVATMQKHEIAVFIIHPDLAYGQLGCPNRIPPNAEVMFIVHLVDYLDNGSADTFDNLSAEEKRIFTSVRKCATDMIVTANDSFKRRNIKLAIRQYTRAAGWLENAGLKNDEEEHEMNQLLSRIYTNLAVCYSKLDQPRRVCSSCNRIPKGYQTAKTYFQHGRALLKMGEYTRAITELQQARQMEPKNEEILKEILVAADQQKEYTDIEKRLWSNCLKQQKDTSKTSEFESAVRAMCATLASDKERLRQPLLDGLTPEEENYIHEQAAAFGLNVSYQTRYGKQSMYLSKPNY